MATMQDGRFWTKDLCLVVTGCSTDSGQKLAKLFYGITDILVNKIGKIDRGGSHTWVLQFSSAEDRDCFYEDISEWKSKGGGGATEITVQYPTASDLPRSWENVKVTQSSEDSCPLQNTTMEELTHEAERTVEVTVDAEALPDRDFVESFFESSRNDGGIVEDVRIDEERKLIFVVFQDPEVAERVTKRQHRICDRPATVRLLSTTAEERDTCRTIEVLVDDDSLELHSDKFLYHFESARNGGGEVENVIIDEERRLVTIVFKDADVALRVMGRQHKISGQPVQVRQKGARTKIFPENVARQTHGDQLFFKNISDQTTSDGLRYFLMDATGRFPTAVVYGDEPGTVLVTFDGDVDLKKIQEKCLEKKLDGSQLEVMEVPISNCLLVSDIHPSITRDMIKQYFEKSSGGNIKELEEVQDKRECYVYFKDYKVIDHVLKKAHKLNGHKMEVSRYTACLGPSGGSKDPLAFPVPPPLVLRDVDPNKLAFLKTPKMISSFCQKLCALHGVPKFSDGTLTVECTLTKDVPKAKYKAHAWRDEVSEVVQDCLGQIEVHTRKVLRTIWEEVSQAVQEAGIRDTEGAALITSPGEALYVVAGCKEAAREMYQTLDMAVKTAEEEIQRRKETVEEKKKLRSFQAQLLAAIKFPEELTEKHKDLKVEILQNEIRFRGSVLDVKDAQLRMHERLESIRSKSLHDLPEENTQLMKRPEARQFISTRLEKLHGGTLHWEVESSGEVTVHAFEGTDISSPLQTIRTSVSQWEIRLSRRSQELIQSSEWKKFVQQHEEVTPLRVIHKKPDKVLLIATTDIMEKARKEIEEFVRSNTVCTQTVCFSPSRQKVFVKLCPQALREVEEKYTQFNVRIHLTDDNTKMVIQGQERGVKEAELELKDAEKKMVCKTETVTDDAEITYLESFICRQNLEQRTATLPCAFSDREEELGVQGPEGKTQASPSEADVLKTLKAQPDPPDCQERQSGSLAMGGENITFNFSPPPPTRATRVTDVSPGAAVNVNSRRVVIEKGEMAQQQVHVIVNSSNVQLNLENGAVSQSLVKKAGPQLQKECKAKFPGGIKEGDVAVTDGFQLNCRKVFHIVLPAYKPGRERDLENTVTACLREAETRRFTSIAFPVLGTRNLGYPCKTVAQAMLGALYSFQETNPRSPLKMKIVVFPADDIAFAVFTETQKELQQAISQGGRIATLSSGLPGDGAVGGLAMPLQQSNLSLAKGEIAKQKTDVIVNTTSSDLQLGLGSVSASILKHAGSEIASECKKKYPQGINTGEIAITSGYKLACKEVVHAALPTYGNPGTAKSVEEMTIKCLEAATQYSSIAFPVLGTGNHGYPPREVAVAMVRAVDEFQRKNPQTSLREIKIVVYQGNDECWKAFNDAMKARRAQPSYLPTPAYPQGRLNSIRTLTFNGRTITVKNGDITEEDVDLIVNGTNRSLDFTRGEVSAALAKKCGERLIKECDEKKGDMGEFGHITTEGYDLKGKAILHIEAEMIKRQASSPKWSSVFTFCMKMADDYGAASCAMPLFGAGRGAQPVSLAEEFFTSVLELSKEKPNSLKEIRVVVRDIQVADSFFDGLKKHAEQRTKRSYYWPLKPAKNITVKERLDLTMGAQVQERKGPKRLVIYADCWKTVDDFMTMFHRSAQREVTTTRVFLETLTDDADEQERHIKKLCHQCNVQVSINDGAAVLHGLNSDVLKAQTEVEKFLKRSVMASVTRWYYIGSAEKKLVPYQLEVNSKIETAYANQQETVEFQHEKRTYVINFKEKIEYPRDYPDDKVAVYRRSNLKGIPEPGHWTPQEEQVTVVPLQPTDEEYQRVEQEFRSTLGNENVTVIQIERVQNKPLYDQYFTKKQQLEKQNPGIQNELRLWHGTASEAICSINHCGFNRSYCGKNAVRFGQGVYFAVTSSYSVRPTYSPADPTTGKRRVYQCAVLVGCPVQGDQNMRALPLRSGTDVYYDSATDDTNNPSMYVIFNDTQAYPEYLITFQ